jgi:hypothetical protein
MVRSAASSHAPRPVLSKFVDGVEPEKTHRLPVGSKKHRHALARVATRSSDLRYSPGPQSRGACP